jgi:hypothetical protein
MSFIFPANQRKARMFRKVMIGSMTFLTGWIILSLMLIYLMGWLAVHFGPRMPNVISGLFTTQQWWVFFFGLVILISGGAAVVIGRSVYREVFKTEEVRHPTHTPPSAQAQSATGRSNTTRPTSPPRPAAAMPPNMSGSQPKPNTVSTSTQPQTGTRTVKVIPYVGTSGSSIPQISAKPGTGRPEVSGGAVSTRQPLGHDEVQKIARQYFSAGEPIVGAVCVQW